MDLLNIVWLSSTSVERLKDVPWGFPEGSVFFQCATSLVVKVDILDTPQNFPETKYRFHKSSNKEHAAAGTFSEHLSLYSPNVP